MALSAQIIALIRDEIGNDADFADNISEFDSALHLDSLENIYTDSERGNYSILRTALLAWRRRLHSLQARSFDVTTEGTLLNRNQRIRFMERKIKHLESLVDITFKGRNMVVQSPYTAEEAATDANASEFT